MDIEPATRHFSLSFPGNLNRFTLRLIWLAALALTCTFSGIAQKKLYYFYGTVTDRVTQAPITSANISFSGTRLGSSSNKSGEFSFFIDTIPVYMTISHLGYETQRLWLDNTSPSFRIQLLPRTQVLKEVEIKAVNEPRIFFKDQQYAVLDYEVDSNLIYLLIYRFRLSQSELICLTGTGDTIARSEMLSCKPSGLFHDCLGYLHVLTADSAYQVFREETHLSLVYPTAMERFKNTLFDCVASTPDLLFFRKISRDGMGVEFYSLNKKTSVRQTISQLNDEAKSKMLRRNPDDYGMLLRERIPEGREAFEQWVWVKKILYKPNASALHRIDNLLCIFNTADYTLELYTLGGEFTSKLKMNIPEIRNEGQWTREIYVDQIDNKAYTSFLKNGKLTLLRINLQNGELKRVLTSTHAYPESIRVHYGYLYYLYDIPGNSDNKHVFRQKM